ncbi:MAG TPA: hypothetical protein VES67_03250 [Vicinamibacterales bacterium]|nr:hypothetical protein [Vicinamibacterales bacterium]
MRWTVRHSRSSRSRRQRGDVPEPARPGVQATAIHATLLEQLPSVVEHLAPASRIAAADQSVD